MPSIRGLALLVSGIALAGFRVSRSSSSLQRSAVRYWQLGLKKKPVLAAICNIGDLTDGKVRYERKSKTDSVIYAGDVQYLMQDSFHVTMHYLRPGDDDRVYRQFYDSKPGPVDITVASLNYDHRVVALRIYVPDKSCPREPGKLLHITLASALDENDVKYSAVLSNEMLIGDHTSIPLHDVTISSKFSPVYPIKPKPK